MNHPGVNNAFQVNTKSPIARAYNDKSVLENFHSFRAFEMLEMKDCNLLQEMDVSIYREFRRTMIGAILATDNALHFELVAKFSTRLESKDGINPDNQVVNFTKVVTRAKRMIEC